MQRQFGITKEGSIREKERERGTEEKGGQMRGREEEKERGERE